MLSIIDDFLAWLLEGWNIICKTGLWLLHGFIYFICLLMILGVIALFSSLFWKNEAGHAMRKSNFWHIAILAISGLLAFGIILYENSKSVNMSKAYGIMSSTPNVVYICTGPHSKRYHFDKNCKGLHHCSGRIILKDPEEAYDEGLRPCGWCAKK